ncbi:MAG: MFS transporter, partial [Aridibacter famidurans]|nr:MFS transporter [Aridibacter famidurans]
VKVPVAILAVALAFVKLPSFVGSGKRTRRSIDAPGTLILIFALGTYALAMTTEKGQVGSINVMLLLASAAGFVFFVLAARRSESPLVELSMFREPGLAAGLVTSALVSTVLMAMLIVGPFYLIGSLHLEVSSVGMVMAVGPVTVALSGIPIGRIVDRVGAAYFAVAGLTAIGSGTALLAALGSSLGLAGYLSATVILTIGYAAFQTANNTGVMRIAGADRKGAVSGMLNLSRNLGLITGSSLMGAVFAYASGSNLARDPGPAAVSYGMRFTFAFATLLIAAAVAIAVRAYRTGGAVLSRVPAGT